MASQLNEFAGLKEKMDQFALELELYLNDQRGEIETIVTSHVNSVNALAEESKRLIEQLQVLTQEQTQLEKDIQELESNTDEVQTRLRVYQMKREQVEQERNTVLAELKELDNLLKHKQADIERVKEQVQQQRQRNSPEVLLYEDVLGLEVNTTKPGILHFNFTRLKEDSLADSKAVLVLSVSGDNYHIIETNPALSANTIQTLQDNLNSSNDISQFLLGARTHFVNTVSK